MKKTALKTLAITGVIAFSAACASAPDSDEAVLSEVQQEKEFTSETMIYPLNLDNSIIEWVGTKSDGRHNGIVQIKQGELAVEGNTITGGRIVMDMKTIEARDEKMDADMNARLTGHLHNEDFFEVDTYPEAILVITSIEPIEGAVTREEDDAHEIEQYRVANPTHIIHGNMTIKNVTQGISFPARLSVTDHEINGRAKFNIDRRDWGIDYTLTGKAILSNTIHLGVAVNASR